ncbi:5-carboxymethyl-2-hydroxymuconate Delta-isomerase [Paraburkholderia sp.]|uniref:5-carboxymethyl-2-hydroxymuconate Delta-isomerase n=1 Tax=Paraburkholderia sp. TaxID=1926495 RepID=UPI002399A8F0|nr:5-carboxymethyl-2-hydroxymuconate Delta-isomerase [Paraburkholderia sp.]MDE1180362.1 5-carboxymethyl-2-hydroxymuconate Delta-isomerase [Paraburkholderia sp.]
MPHITLEYSANLDEGDSIQRLCNTLAKCLDAQRDGTGDNAQHVFPIGGIRVRAVRCDAYCIADGRADAAFLHANVRIAAGRPEAVKTAAANALFDAIKAHFAAYFEANGLALSLEVNEFSDAGALKHNNLHARLKKEG